MCLLSLLGWFVGCQLAISRRTSLNAALVWGRFPRHSHLDPGARNRMSMSYAPCCDPNVSLKSNACELSGGSDKERNLVIFIIPVTGNSTTFIVSAFAERGYKDKHCCLESGPSSGQTILIYLCFDGTKLKTRLLTRNRGLCEDTKSKVHCHGQLY